MKSPMKKFCLEALAVTAVFAVVLCAVQLVAPGAADPALAFDPIHTLGPGLLLGGLVVNKTSLENITRNLKATFNKVLETVESKWMRLAMDVMSTGAENDYHWLSRFPKMRKWVGERQIQNLEAYSWTIKNEEFESTIEVKRTDIEDDNLGIYRPVVSEAGLAAKHLYDELVAELLNNAFANACYDGQPFIDTDHPVGDATYSNKLTAPLSAATQAAAIASLGAARTRMRKLKDEEGRPLGLRPRLLVVPPALEDTANVLAMNDRLEDGKPNPYKGTVEVLVLEYLTSDTAWFLLDDTRELKPLVVQQRTKPEFQTFVDPNNEHVFKNNKFLYGAYARGNAGYGLWQLIVGSDGTG